MREILFRGKHNDEWVYGIPFHRIWGGLTPHGIAAIRSDKPPHHIYSVISETVGEFTGLTDKNGTTIFEGDIVKLFDKYIRYVIYKENECSFFTNYIDKDGKENLYWLGSIQDKNIEVIGNIHDNPELLEAI